ncbi:MAG TPA: hypothetical protein VN132_04190, partial [Bdellovibrio sp.]|nr:hypothetical protein [Bdellovibrio sp.]
MNYYLYKVSNRYIKHSFLVWSVLTLAAILFFKLQKIGEIDSEFFVLFFISSFICVDLTWKKSSLNSADFMRRMSRNIQHFWSLTLLCNVIHLIVNCIFCFLAVKLFHSVGLHFEDFQLSYQEVAWVLLIIFSLDFLFGSLTIHNSKNFFFRLMAFYFLITLLVFLWAFSRLLGYAVLEATLLTFFVFANFHVRRSLTPAIRKRLLGAGLGVVTILASVSYMIEWHQSQGNSILLGALGAKHVPNIENVDTPSLWLKKFGGRVLSGDQLKEAVGKLSELCPVHPTDRPTVVECKENKNVYGRGEFTATLSQPEMVTFLDSPSELNRLVAL